MFERDEENKVVYRSMTPEDVPAAATAMSQAFFEGEPTTVIAGGASLRDMERFVAMYLPRMAVEGYTVLAQDSETGAILGGFMNEDFSQPDPEEMGEFLAGTDGNWMPCLTMIGELEATLMETHGIPLEAAERGAGKWLHMWMIGVLTSARGRNIGVKLARHTVEMARERGFELAFAECTGGASTAIMTKKCGQTVERFIDYSSWDGHEDSRILRQLPKHGHQGMSLTVSLFK